MMMSRIFFVAVLALSCTVVAANENNQNQQCPEELVSFWNSFSMKKGKVASGIPEFLQQNRCLESQGTSSFYNAAILRLDDPENSHIVDQMYAELSWAEQ